MRTDRFRLGCSSQGDGNIMMRRIRVSAEIVNVAQCTGTHNDCSLVRRLIVVQDQRQINVNDRSRRSDQRTQRVRALSLPETSKRLCGRSARHMRRVRSAYTGVTNFTVIALAGSCDPFHRTRGRRTLRRRWAPHFNSVNLHATKERNNHRGRDRTNGTS